MTPAVSVCIPVYNGARTIGRAIQSVLESTGLEPGQVEIVICDDCSSDGTREILQTWARRPEVRVHLNEKNLGLTGNWQRALSLGRAPVVTLLHMDDWYVAECLQAVLQRFREDPRILLLAVGQEHRLEDGTRVDKNPGWHSGAWNGAEYFRKQLLFVDCPAPSMTFFRRSALEGLSVLYDSAYRWCPELDLYLRLAEKHGSAAFVHDGRRLVLRGASTGQFSFRYPALSILDTCTALEGHLRSLSQEDQVASWKASQRAISLDLLALMRLGDRPQMQKLARSRELRWWLRTNPMNVVGVAQFVLGRAASAGLRALKRASEARSSQ